MRNLLILLFAASTGMTILFGYALEYPSARQDALIALDDRNIVPQELHFVVSGCPGRLWAFGFQGVQADRHVSGLVCVGGVLGAQVTVENGR